MKILVIDDNLTHLEAASQQLKDHEVTAVSSYVQAQELLGFFRDWQKRTNSHTFDVVLVDLLMPASGQQVADGTRLVGTEMPVGIFLALLAAKNGAKYVAVLTDSDHHSHPASACFDAFNPDGETRPDTFSVAGAKVLLTNNRNWVGQFEPEDLSRELDYEEFSAPGKQSTRAKNWKELLDYLLK